MSSLAFKRIILYARQHRISSEVSDSLQRLVDYLLTLHLTVFLHSDSVLNLQLDLPRVSTTELGIDGDLIVVVGGDGSMLSAARMAIKVDVPVIGINRGRLGFLTDISAHELEAQLGTVLFGNYIEERRFLLQAQIYDDSNVYYQGDALNDVVLSRGNDTHLIKFDVYINRQFVSHYRADGLILATPTGSTAYALSAGGPIMHPEINATVVVPMFSHSLNARPLVIDGLAVIDLKISIENERDLQISCDGHESHLVKPGQGVLIEKNRQQLRLLHPPNYNYYDTLRIKLGWGSRP